MMGRGGDQGTPRGWALVRTKRLDKTRYGVYEVEYGVCVISISIDNVEDGFLRD